MPPSVASCSVKLWCEITGERLNGNFYGEAVRFKVENNVVMDIASLHFRSGNRDMSSLKGCP